MNMGEPASASSTEFLISSQTGPTQRALMQGPAPTSSFASPAGNVGPQPEINLYQPTLAPLPAIAHVMNGVNGENTGPLPIVEEQAEYNPYEQDAPGAVTVVAPGVDKRRENMGSFPGGEYHPYVPEPALARFADKMKGEGNATSLRSPGPPPPYVDVQRL
jgi:hypothetical protein